MIQVEESWNRYKDTIVEMIIIDWTGTYIHGSTKPRKE